MADIPENTPSEAITTKAAASEIINEAPSPESNTSDTSASLSSSSSQTLESENVSAAFQRFTQSELVIGLVGAVGTDFESLIEDISHEFSKYNYEHNEIRMSRHVIPKIIKTREKFTDEHDRITHLIKAGNESRRLNVDNAVLADVAISILFLYHNEKEKGTPKGTKRVVHIINSLKRKEEVERFREVYGSGFFLLGVYTDQDKRTKFLCDRPEKQIEPSQALELMRVDEEEDDYFGQRTRDTFHLADFFINARTDDIRKNSVVRIIKLLFGCPYLTPTFDEMAMFMSFASALRSADLSRQVGAVIAANEEILATGANECPKSGGGLYWPLINTKNGQIFDCPDGRDYKRKFDSNARERERIVNELARKGNKCVTDICERLSSTINECCDENSDAAIANKIKEILSANKSASYVDDFVEAFKNSSLKDLTEYGRVVHAEMEAIISCARKGISCRGATLYCTTFPCHNCAKHIIAAGIKRVVYVEPYPKSKAPQFHDDSLTLGVFQAYTHSNKVYFEPFVGVGPRNFVNLFSMELGIGEKLVRKSGGRTLTWRKRNANLRMAMLPHSYLERERARAAFASRVKKGELR